MWPVSQSENELAVLSNRSLCLKTRKMGITEAVIAMAANPRCNQLSSLGRISSGPMLPVPPMTQASKNSAIG
jgi:hypothetical protein